MILYHKMLGSIYQKLFPIIQWNLPQTSISNCYKTENKTTTIEQDEHITWNMNNNKQKQYNRKQRIPNIIVFEVSIDSSKFKYRFYLIIGMLEYTKYHYSKVGNTYVFSALREQYMYLKMIYIMVVNWLRPWMYIYCSQLSSN